ncbi:MAG: hypothetical protein ACR2J1_04085 [Methyloceanibacter sp.]|uniref:hypothetical protein n=1 Tax=Methyloceanibacter sp. TaxID=1965321 RepID=UPI003D9BF41E
MRSSVEAIVGLGRVLGLQVTAEGIETQETLDLLLKLRDRAGLFLRQAEPAAEVARPLSDRSRHIA